MKRMIEPKVTIIPKQSLEDEKIVLEVSGPDGFDGEWDLEQSDSENQ
ncbi:MAG: hypothetical protein IJ811_04490 [Clostridia bacterium]|nr:hypothetical protein [Clostridia bacterium]